MYSVTYSREAAKGLRKLPRDRGSRIVRKINAYAQDPASLANNVKRLSGHPGYRLRVGDWRVLFLIEENRQNLHVTWIGSRGGAYE